LSNFSEKDLWEKGKIVRLQNLILSTDCLSLLGTVVVKNIAFQKSVSALFTFDNWKTTSDIVATYSNIPNKKQTSDSFDKFYFDIELPGQADTETVSMLLCVRYRANGEEFWDNNKNRNFLIELKIETLCASKKWSL